MSASTSAFAQPPAPTVVATSGYINGTPLTAHTTNAFDSRNATTLLAFVSTNTPWNGLPVSISGVTDNMGNTWNVLTGPTTWQGSSLGLESAIYYVTLPATSATHTVTATLTNGAPLVMHVVAAAGTDPTAPPIFSPITGAPGQVTDVLSPPITVPVSTLLFAWAKNEDVANAVALDGYQLDAQSTSFLWAEQAIASAAGSYSGHFQYSNPIGWQTAIVGLTPLVTPIAFNQAVTTFENTPVNVTLSALTPNHTPLTYSIVGLPAHGIVTGALPNATYTPNAGYTGPDAFTFKANDGFADSNVAAISVTVRLPNHPPVASDSTATVTTGLQGAVGLTASDADGDPLSFAIVTPPAHGSLTGSGASRIYLSNSGFIGTDTFTFTANDGFVNSNLGHVTVTVVAQPPTSSIVSTRGYLNGTALAAHTTTAFDSRTASTLVAFVSSHPVWNGLPVSISSVTDNLGNTWQLLTGPTTWAGTDFTLMSSIYYVQLPATSATHTVTATLTNGAPLVMNVVAAAGTNIIGPPTYSPIAVSAAGPSTDVLTAPITVPAGTLLYGWAKNEDAANALALDGFTLDAQSTGFLWSEYATAGTSGAYAGHFNYNPATGWETAIVGLIPASGPMAVSQSITTHSNLPASITLVGASPHNFPLTYTIVSSPAHGTLSGTTPHVTYTPIVTYSGPDAFTFKVNDGTGDSNVATVTITVKVPNRAPVASAGSATVESGAPVPVTLTATDADLDPLTFTVLTQPVHGTLTGVAPNLVYTPAVTFAGTDSFTFKANDGLADSNVATVTITVTAPQPLLVNFTPTTGAVGTPVTLLGFGLQPATQVRFNGTVQSAFTVGPATTLEDFTTNAGPINGAVGDLDGDGKPDIAVANHGFSGNIGNTVSVFRNLSTPGAVVLAPRLDLVTTPGPHDIAMTDIDGDGKLDLVMPNYGAFASGNTVTVIRNTSTVGNLSFATPLNFTVNQGPPSVAIGDLDGDGKPDVIVTGFDDGAGRSVSILRNTSTPGNVSFAPHFDLGTLLGPYGVAVGDFDGDGKLDIAVSAFGTFAGEGASILVWRNTSTPGTLSFATAQIFAVGAGPREMAIADIDKDGKVDLVVANYGGNGSNNTVTVLRNTSTIGNIAFAPKVDFTVGQGPIRVKLVDLTFDGRPEILSGNYGNGVGQSITALINTSTPGTVSFGQRLDAATELGPHGLTLGDIDGDGFVDLVPTNYGNLQGSGTTLSVIRYTGDSMITANVPSGATTGPITVVTPGGSTTSGQSFTVLVPSLTINDVTVAEGDTGSVNATFTVTLSAASSQTVTVNYATANVTATAGSDYTATSGTLTFTPGSTTRTITVAVLGDLLNEPTETFNVNLSAPVNATIADGTGVGTITDNDPTPTLSINDVAVTEGNIGSVNANFTVTLSRASGRTVTVNYATANGTAIAGSDYTAKSGTLTFAPGTATQTIAVAVLGDVLDEGNETFTVGLSGAVNATVADSTGTGTIVDDDAAPSLSINNVSVTEGNTGSVNANFTVTLSAVSGLTVTVNYATANGTATAGSDYTAKSGTLTFAPGTTTQTIAVAVLGDVLDEGNETFTVGLSGAVNATIAAGSGTGTIVDDDAPPSLSINDVSVTEGNSGSVNANFTVSLSAVSGQTVTVNYATANGTATAGSDYTAKSGTLTFAPGTTTQTIAVAVLGDVLDEGNETFTVGLSGAVNATIADSTGIGTIVDDDPSPTLSINDVAVTEGNSGAANASFTVTLSAVSGRTVTVNYATANGTATSGSDYTAVSGTLTFPAGTTTQTINVPVLGDTTPEANETFVVNLSVPVNATIARTQGTGTINNNDGAIVVTSPNTNVTWTVGSVHAITWVHNLGAGTTSRVEVSRNGGSTWTVIAAAVTNGSTTGSFNWAVTGPATTTARVRVTWTTNSGVTDTSDVNFRIQ